MSTVPKPLVVRAHLQIAALRLLLRFVNSRAFRLLMTPFIRTWVWYRLVSMVFGATPNSWANASPEVAQLVRQLEAARNAPIQVAAVPSQHRVSQALTWGVAGFALIALIQIVTAQPAHISPARWMACGCFALVVPWLAVLGFAAHDHMDPKRPPTVQQTLNMLASMYAGNVVFCLGLASLLWSYNPSIAGIFVLSCFVAVRRFLSFAKKRAATAPAPQSAIILPP